MKLLRILPIIAVSVIALSCFSETASPLLSDENQSSIGTNSSYMIGTGIHNITGPPAEVMFAGYCDFDQVGGGMYMRQWARAFIIKDNGTGKRVAFVVLDIPMMDSGILIHVLDRLKDRYGNLYNEKNIVMSATHTHSGPGGYFKTYALNIFAGMTFHEGNFNAIVNGACEAIVKAHNSLVPGKILLNSGLFSPKINTGPQFSPRTRISRNRSPEAYNLNRDRDQYLLPDGSLDDTNRELTQLKFVNEEGSDIGLYHWTPVHPNMSGSHLFLINGDVNGLASYFFESSHGMDYSVTEGFVAAFAQNDCADTSGNLPEDANLSRFEGRDKKLVRDENGGIIDWIADGSCDYERVELRARTLELLARELSTEGTELTGAIDYRQMFIPAQEFDIRPEFIDDDDIYYEAELGESRENCRLCMGSAGVSFIAGSTEDGDSGMVSRESNPRDIDNYAMFTPQEIITDPLPGIADILLRLIVSPSELRDEMDCQKEKRIALAFDELNNLIPGGKAWNLSLPVQIVKIGGLAIVTLPLEVTTMSGRRIKAEVRRAMPDVKHVVINATSNSDGRYLTTREEYAAQEYEGGATLLGPYSLNAVRQVVYDLAMSFRKGADLPSYAVDYDEFRDGIEGEAIFKIAGNVLYDDVPADVAFGDVKTAPNYAYSRGNTASTVFWGGHPNNNLTILSDESYLTVERLSDDESGQWLPVAHDWDPSTKYRWQRSGTAANLITIEWDIPVDAMPGTYRIRHTGYYKKALTGKILRYEGVTKEFSVY
ncbi:MAG: hypothetical protein CVV44_07030 [Spirochaetae bacterium HGW-Spirochaetae-1]|jgi:neutral ceramidase|nr:MAG: hypothetical protein CVV44_07030 [Spirochaetae bacterium HGW-Spirochaetae-1]